MDRIKKTVAFDTPMTTTTPNTLSKWIPLICAGAAAGDALQPRTRPAAAAKVARHARAR